MPDDARPVPGPPRSSAVPARPIAPGRPGLPTVGPVPGAGPSPSAMPARRPVPGEGHGASAEDSATVAELRRASAAVEALDADRPAPEPGSASDRDAGSDREPGPDRDADPAAGPRADFDPGVHAERFEAVHDALVAVLADIDRS